MKLHLEDFVYGAIDGAVTTFAVVSGAIGASLSPAVILILGFANLFADGLSMAIGNYMASKTNREYIEKERRSEEWEVENAPEEGEQEIREIYSKKGFEGELLEKIVQVITEQRKVWVDTMMTEELGLIEDSRNPKETAASTFIGFGLIGLIPLIPFIFLLVVDVGLTTQSAFIYSFIFTGVAFTVVGVFKAKVVNKPVLSSALSTLLIGGVAAIVAYGIGLYLSTLI